MRKIKSVEEVKEKSKYSKNIIIKSYYITYEDAPKQRVYMDEETYNIAQLEQKMIYKLGYNSKIIQEYYGSVRSKAYIEGYESASESFL